MTYDDYDENLLIANTVKTDAFQSINQSYF